jgi:hypothetical protein
MSVKGQKDAAKAAKQADRQARSLLEAEQQKQYDSQLASAEQQRSMFEGQQQLFKNQFDLQAEANKQTETWLKEMTGSLATGREELVQLQTESAARDEESRKALIDQTRAKYNLARKGRRSLMSTSERGFELETGTLGG